MRSLLGFALALAVALPALAQQPEKRDAKPRAEASAAAGGTAVQHGGLFDRLDANRDGFLSAEELAREPAAEASWIALDRNADGRISRDEFTTVGAAERR